MSSAAVPSRSSTNWMSRFVRHPVTSTWATRNTDDSPLPVHLAASRHPRRHTAAPCPGGTRRQGDYEWLTGRHTRTEHAAAEDRLPTQIREIHDEHHGAYGSPRMTTQLRRRGRQVVFAYISYYNHNRLHSTLELRTPHEARACYGPPTALGHETPVPDPGVEPQTAFSGRMTCQHQFRITVVDRMCHNGLTQVQDGNVPRPSISPEDAAHAPEPIGPANACVRRPSAEVIVKVHTASHMPRAERIQECGSRVPGTLPTRSQPSATDVFRSVRGMSVHRVETHPDP